MNRKQQTVGRFDKPIVVRLTMRRILTEATNLKYLRTDFVP